MGVTVAHECDAQTDRQTDGRTYLLHIQYHSFTTFALPSVFLGTS